MGSIYCVQQSQVQPAQDRAVLTGLIRGLQSGRRRIAVLENPSMHVPEGAVASCNLNRSGIVVEARAAGGRFAVVVREVKVSWRGYLYLSTGDWRVNAHWR